LHKRRLVRMAASETKIAIRSSYDTVEEGGGRKKEKRQVIITWQSCKVIAAVSGSRSRLGGEGFGEKEKR